MKRRCRAVGWAVASRANTFSHIFYIFRCVNIEALNCNHTPINRIPFWVKSKYTFLPTLDKHVKLNKYVDLWFYWYSESLLRSLLSGYMAPQSPAHTLDLWFYKKNKDILGRRFSWIHRNLLIMLTYYLTRKCELSGISIMYVKVFWVAFLILPTISQKCWCSVSELDSVGGRDEKRVSDEKNDNQALGWFFFLFRNMKNILDAFRRGACFGWKNCE